MKAMLLCAGEGRRLRPVTDRLPKCMVPVGGKPLVQHTVEWLARWGVTELMINLHHLPQIVMDYFGDGSRWRLRIAYSVEEELLGTAGGLKNVAWFFDEPFLVWYGDNLSTCRLDRLWERHRAAGGVATMALYYRDDPTSSGIAGLDEQGRITCFLEKPRPEQVFSHWVNAGILALEPEVLDVIPPTPLRSGMPSQAGQALDLARDVLPALLGRGAGVYGYCLSAGEGLWWIDTPEALDQVQQAWSAGGGE